MRVSQVVQALLLNAGRLVLALDGRVAIAV